MPLVKAADPNLYLVGRDYDDQARDLYRPEDYPSRLWAYVTMETDAVRGCQVRKLARAVKTQVPVHRYLYTHAYQNHPGLADLRASHVLENLFLWHAFANILYTPTAAEEQLRKSRRHDQAGAQQPPSGPDSCRCCSSRRQVRPDHLGYVQALMSAVADALCGTAVSALEARTRWRRDRQRSPTPER